MSFDQRRLVSVAGRRRDKAKRKDRSRHLVRRYPLIPAKAGTQSFLRWVPAFAGMSGGPITRVAIDAPDGHVLSRAFAGSARIASTIFTVSTLTVVTRIRRSTTFSL